MMAYPLNLWEAIAGLLGGAAAFLPEDRSRRHPPGYDAEAARWAQIAQGLMDAGVRVAAAPRGQAIGQGVRGFIEGLDSGRRAYEGALPDGADSLPIGSYPGSDVALFTGPEAGDGIARYGLQPALIWRRSRS